MDFAAGKHWACAGVKSATQCASSKVAPESSIYFIDVFNAHHCCLKDTESFSNRVYFSSAILFHTHTHVRGLGATASAFATEVCTNAFSCCELADSADSAVLVVQ